MKKVISLLLSVLMVVSVFSVCTVSYADEALCFVDGNAYKYVVLADGTCEITGFNNNTRTTDVVIPDNLDGRTVTSLGKNSFSNHSYTFTSVVLPNTLTNIGEMAFWNCQKLTSITIPDSVVKIGDSAFLHCDGITSLYIGSSVKTIEKSAFAYAKKLTSLTIPDSVEYIGKEAFTGSAISSLHIGSGVKTIEESAFYGSSIENLVIPANVSSIGAYAFNTYATKSLKKVTIANPNCKIANAYNVFYNGNIVEICGYAGSTAQQYVNNNPFDYKFTAIDLKPTKITKVTGKKKGLSVSYKKISTVFGYEIQCATDKKFTKNVSKKKVSSFKTTSASFSKLKSKKTYYVRVRTYKKVGSKTYYSSWSGIKSVKTK